MRFSKQILSLLCVICFVMYCAGCAKNNTANNPKPQNEPISQDSQNPQSPQNPQNKPQNATASKESQSPQNTPTSQDSQARPTLQSPLQSAQKRVIFAKNGDSIDANNYPNTLYLNIIFNNDLLVGGIFDEAQKLYKSPDRELLYTLEGDTLTIKNIPQNQHFTITHFSDGDFNIYLSKNPTKEVAIVLNTNKSMSNYISALKGIAPFVGEHILGDRSKQFAKISLVTFTYIRLSERGTFYDVQDFANTLNGVNANNIASSDNMVNLSLIMGMRHFTNANGLKKEVFLITDGAADDPQNLQRVLSTAKNLKTHLTGTDKDNLLKIHIFAIKPFNSRKSASENVRLLKNIANATGGTYNEIENVVELKEKVLLFSNDGKPFDKKEIGNEIRIIETHKIDDPDKPNGDKQ
ncbi:hypothetical protein [Helicobacter sp. T3_23-1056]